MFGLVSCQAESVYVRVSALEKWLLLGNAGPRLSQFEDPTSCPREEVFRQALNKLLPLARPNDYNHTWK